MKCTFDSHSMPIAQIMIITINATVPMSRTSFIPLSMIFKLCSRNKSFRESQKPMVFMDAETAFANAKTIPTEAPNSAPSVLDMMKYIPPVQRNFNLYVIGLNEFTMEIFSSATLSSVYAEVKWKIKSKRKEDAFDRITKHLFDLRKV